MSPTAHPPSSAAASLEDYPNSATSWVPWSPFGPAMECPSASRPTALQHRLARLQYNGGPDNVAAGEFEGTSEKREAMVIMNGG